MDKIFHRLPTISMARRKIPALFSLICLFSVALLILVNLNIEGFFFFILREKFRLRPSANSDAQLFGQTIGCEMPLFVDPFDPFILPFLVNKTLKCQQSSQQLTYVDEDGWLRQIDDDNEDDAPGGGNEDEEDDDVGDDGGLTCYYSSISRGKGDDKVIYGSVETIPKKGVKMNQDMMIVNTSCTKESSILYNNIHLNVPLYPQVSPNPDKPNVFILVIESLSRLSFQRFMPKTKETMDKIGSFQDLLHINRVEENSFPNSMALLAGIAVTDDAASILSGVRWDHQLPFIWDDFKATGNYVTGFMEDQPMVGLFSYYNRGFKESPTDFHPVPFFSHMYPNGSQDLYQLLTNPKHYCFEKIGAKVDMYLDLCLKFSRSLESQRKPYFMYAFHSQMTHEDFNNFQLVDQPVARFLQQMEPLLDNTVFILLGDHGPRMNGASDSPMGRMEGSLPHFSMRIPEKLDKKYPHLRKYLALNEERLSTWFDVHAMLLDIAQGNFNPIGPRKDVPTSYSPLREEIPITRDCDMANIGPEFCACNGKVGINPKFKYHHIEAAKGMVDSLRTVLQKNHCKSKIQYLRTLKGYYLYPTNGESFSLNEKVHLTIEVTPSKAVINAVVYRWRNSTDSRWKPWQLMSTKLKSKEFTQSLTSILCTSKTLRNVTVEI